MIVVDTNVASELMRSAPAPDVVAWVRAQGPADLHTTAVTVAEIGYGIERLPDGQRKDQLRQAAREVFAAFDDKVLPFDLHAADEYVTVVVGRERQGVPINGFDAQIAAICRARGAALATRNVKDFVGVGVDVLDPWQGNDGGTPR